MTGTVTGMFESTDQARNVKDDLRAAGIPSEEIYVDEPAKTIRILIPDAIKPGVLEILKRHQLKAISR